ncbi:MAG: SH3 domain-containing protein [Clostridia bacterium]|nr:SH3 domain-containing protein [Clostridia bacterium]
MQNTKKKAACAAMLCMAMAAPFGALADETRVITCGTLNLRAEANTTSAVLGKYGWGTQVNVKTIDGEWASVDVGGQSGYMYAKYLGSEGSTNATRYVATNSRGLNLRATPNGDILGSYPRGTAVTVLSTDGAWSKVSVNGQTGYMSSQWLSGSKPSGSGTTTTPSNPSTPASGTAVVNNPRDTQVLFLRSEPSISSASLGYYRNGKTVTLLAKQGDWYKVKVDGKTGYMMAKYLKVTQAITSGTAVVYNPNGNSYVNFRKSASLNSAVLSTVPVGTTIKVLEKTTDWTKTEINGVTGYISTWFLKF